VATPSICADPLRTITVASATRAVRIEDGDVERLLARGRHLRLRLRVELCRGQPIDVADHPHHYAEARDADDERDNQPDR